MFEWFNSIILIHYIYNYIVYISDTPKKRCHNTRVHIALLIFSGSLATTSTGRSINEPIRLPENLRSATVQGSILALLIFSGSSLIGSLILLPVEVVLSSQTTREYEKCYMEPCTVAPLFRGADGPNCIHNSNFSKYFLDGTEEVGGFSSNLTATQHWTECSSADHPALKLSWSVERGLYQILFKLFSIY